MMPAVVSPTLLFTRDGQSLLLRGVTEDDAKGLTAFYRSLDQHTDRMFFILAEFGEDVAADMSRLHASGCEMHLVVEGPEGDIIGHLSMQPFPAVCPRLGICLKQGWQGRGLGRRMMEIALDLAESVAGCTGVWLSVLEDNRPAIALYESLAFRRVRTRLVRRKYSRYRRNRGAFRLVDMVLMFPQPENGAPLTGDLPVAPTDRT